MHSSLPLQAMEPLSNQQDQQQQHNPNLFWEGFFYLSFFVFFDIVVIPYAPKSITFDQYYPLAMVIVGGAGLFVGMLAFRVMKNWPNFIKAGLFVVMYGIILWYLIENINKFTVPWM